MRSIPLSLLPKDTDGFRVSDLEAIVAGANQNSFDERVRAAYALSWRKRCDAGRMPKEWRIQTSDKSLLLTGGKPRGAIYAVCEFLETHVGVERLDPFTEFVPKQPTTTACRT